jgi:putative redox protein
LAHKTVVTWKEELAFDVELDGHHFMVDADKEFGGKNRGPRPKALLLSGLAGCTGMDVASLLDKMKVPFEEFKLEVEGDMADQHPKVYKKIVIRYVFTGDKLDRDKIEKAVQLSIDKYCAVHTILSKTAKITHEIILNPGS